MNNQVAALNWNETKNHESRAVPMETHVVYILFSHGRDRLIKNTSLRKKKHNE